MESTIARRWFRLDTLRLRVPRARWGRLGASTGDSDIPRHRRKRDKHNVIIIAHGRGSDPALFQALCGVPPALQLARVGRFFPVGEGEIIGCFCGSGGIRKRSTPDSRLPRNVRGSRRSQLFCGLARPGISSRRRTTPLRHPFEKRRREGTPCKPSGIGTEGFHPEGRTGGYRRTGAVFVDHEREPAEFGRGCFSMGGRDEFSGCGTQGALAPGEFVKNPTYVDIVCL